MEYKIVEMTSEHISEIALLEKGCFSSPWSENSLSEELNNESSHFIVAVSDNVLGYIGVQEICGEAYITNIAVFKEYRKSGIGRNLLKSAIDGAVSRNCEFITLEVRESNTSAIALYSSQGFVKEGIRKNFYEMPVENAVIMWKHEQL